MMRHYILQPYLILALLGFVVFASFGALRNKLEKPNLVVIAEERVVISASILTVLYGADSHLAANLESMRLASTSFNYYTNDFDVFYLVRSHQVVTKLNPCHEDNYYWANAFLVNSGVVAEGNGILVQSSNCRFWDGVPSFLYGVNEILFNNNLDDAIKALIISAKRWEANRITINNMVLSLRARRFDDAEQALAFLQHEYNTAKNERSKKGLVKRIERIQILIDLRKAQQKYEQQYGQLENLGQLVEKQIIANLPEDPLYLGFELKNGRIELKQLSWAK